MTRNGVPYGLGAMTLGGIGLAFHDFALQWQPVAKDQPGRVGLAIVSALAMLALGAGVLWPRAARRAALGLAMFYASWVLWLHSPLVGAHPTSVAAWLGVAEVSALAAGGLALFSTDGERVADARLRLTARLLLGVCALVFGLSHFAYAGFTAAMVPGWIPLPLFWAYATGCGHVAAGLALLSGVASRLATTLLTAMMGAFVVMVHAPRVMNAPDSQMEWTLLAIALSLTGAAWAVRQSLPRPAPSADLTLNFVGRQAQGRG